MRPLRLRWLAGLPAPRAQLVAAGAARPRVEAAMAALRAAAPETGAYVNECDYFSGGLAEAFGTFRV
jgi:hypothetical protein